MVDFEIESAVMKSIESLSSDLTILIIAHRTSTLKNCSQIIKFDKSGGVIVGDYNDIV